MDDGDAADRLTPGEDAPAPSVPETSETADTSDTPPHEPPTLETALTWLARVKPAPLLALLRDPNFALVSVTAFAGFRVNAAGYANPLVRRRLAQEAVRDEKFAEKLQGLAEAPTPPPPEGERGQGQDAVRDSHSAAGQNGSAALPEAQGGSDRPFSPSLGGPSGVPVLKAATTDRGPEAVRLRGERDRRRRERDEARQALAVADAARLEAERRQQQAEVERDEASQLSQKQAQRIARLERQVGKLQTERAGLVRSLKQREAGVDTPSAPSESPSPSPAMGARGISPWTAAVAHLLDKRRYDLALSLADDVLRSDPDDATALDIAARALAAKGNTREAVALLRRRLGAAVARGERAEAADILVRLLPLTPGDGERDLRAFLSGLRPEDTQAVEQARTMLARLRIAAPESFASVAALITQAAPAALAEALMPPPGLIGPDDPLPLGLPGTITARRLVEAVDTGNVGLVEGARAALTRLGRTDPGTQERMRQALARAAGEDSSALVPLLGGRERGPVVVDGSNAAWYDQETLAAGRPRLRPLLGLRRALRARGYFPVLLYADAPLPYTVDEPDTLRAMAARGEITLVDSGTDADEVMLREAKRFGAPLVTNDYMADWDPHNEVPKIRFTLSLTGEAYLMSE